MDLARAPRRAPLTARKKGSGYENGLWPNPYSELASDWLVLTPDIVFLPCFCGIRLWIWPEPLVAPRVRRALGTRMDWIIVAHSCPVSISFPEPAILGKETKALG